MLILRLLKNLDFQPRLGLVTRTLSSAIVNLSHFLVVFGLVFFSYSVMGHLAFGGELEKVRVCPRLFLHRRLASLVANARSLVAVPQPPS